MVGSGNETLAPFSEMATSRPFTSRSVPTPIQQGRSSLVMTQASADTTFGSCAADVEQLELTLAPAVFGEENVDVKADWRDPASELVVSVSGIIPVKLNEGQIPSELRAAAIDGFLSAVRTIVG